MDPRELDKDRSTIADIVTAEKVDAEVMRIVGAAHDKALRILRAYRALREGGSAELPCFAERFDRGVE